MKRSVPWLVSCGCLVLHDAGQRPSELFFPEHEGLFQRIDGPGSRKLSGGRRRGHGADQGRPNAPTQRRRV